MVFRLPFNRTSIRSLCKGQKLSQKGITALKLEDGSEGDVHYSINVMVDGVRHHRVIGKASEGVTLTQAQQAIEVLRTRAREDRLNLPKGRKIAMSFAEAARQYLERLEATDGKDLANKRRHLNHQLIPTLGNERLDKISEFRLKEYRRKRADEGASSATINREMATLSHLMRQASSKAWNWINKQDVPRIPKEKEHRKQIQILSADQRQRLLDAALADEDPRTWLFVMFGLNCAMRHGEIVSRRYDECDFDHCRIWINKAKAGEREQPITLALKDALLRQREIDSSSNDWIFPAVRSDTKGEHRPDMQRAFARVVKRAGLDPKQCTPHVMRHTAITMLVKAKADIPTIQRISGHKTPAMVLHYVHIHGQHIDDAISALDTSRPLTSPELHAPDLEQPSKAA